MDLRTVVTISALLFTTAESNAHLNGTNSTENSPTAQTSVTGGCLCPGGASTQTTSSPRSPTTVLGLLYIEWRNTCEGNVQIRDLSNSSTPVCYSSGAAIRRFLIQECTKPCKGQVYLSESKSTADGYNITGSEVKKMTCQTLKAKCKAEEPDGADVRGQLKAYKVVTALLCCVLVVLFLIRFTRPTVKALQKRLSDKRQNRWIGPTQSHSVSYHRGKTAVKNNEGEKRLSYPALERLAVFDSREPSSNRNSDYNL